MNLVLGFALLVFVLQRYGAGALAVLQREPSVGLVLAFLACATSVVVCLAWRWGEILRGVQAPLPLLSLTLYRSASHSLAVVVPSGKLGGDPLRAWLAYRRGAPAEHAIASVAIDRSIEMASTVPFSILFVTLLLQHGVPQLEKALVTVGIGALGLAIGIAIAVVRLRRGSGLVTAIARSTRLDRIDLVDAHMDLVDASEASAACLVGQPLRLAVAFGAGLVANLLVVVEFWLLLAAFGLPADPIAVVAALFATGASHLVPVPAGVGVLEGSQMWLFEMLGYTADVGLAVGLAVRLRELLWMLPGLLFLLLRPLPASPQRAGEA